MNCPVCKGELEVDGEGGGWCEACEEYWPAAEREGAPRA